MQARFLSASALVLTLAAATPAFALVPELPVCGVCSADLEGGANGGVWKTTDGGTAAETEHDRHVFVNNATPAAHGGAEAAQDVFVTEAHTGADQAGAADQVQTAPQPNMPIFLELDGIPGESSETPRSPPPPPPPPPQNAPSAEQGLQAQSGASAALLVPAVQRLSRETAGLPTGSAPAPNDPELPICAHCGADAPAQAEAPAAPGEQPQRRRGGFSISFGGITVGSGGVSVAAGDVNGDGRESHQRSERRRDR